MMLNIIDDLGQVLEIFDRIISGILGSVIVFVYGLYEVQE